jgi:sugar O-acyltransferase (sialic acid O-acetyltransferase NeuD family)
VEKLFIIGAGGLGLEVAWAAKLQKRYALGGFCDDDVQKTGQTLASVQIVGTIEAVAERYQSGIMFLCAIGDNRKRESAVARALAHGWRGGIVMDPSVIIGPDVQLGAGTYVGAGSILSPEAKIGQHVIINHGCSIGHHSRVLDFAQVCPGGRVSGHSILGRAAFMGSNAVVGPGKALGDYAVLGAASFALGDVPAGATAVGNPARILFRSSGA